MEFTDELTEKMISSLRDEEAARSFVKFLSNRERQVAYITNDNEEGQYDLIQEIKEDT